MEQRHLLPLVLLLSACQSGPEPESLSGTNASIDYPTFIARLIRADCSAIYDCCDTTERSGLVPDWPDYDACVAAYEAALAEYSGVSLIESGAILFDGTAAASCIAEIESATCLESAELRNRFLEGPCANVGRGTAPLGADCNDGHTVACASGLCSNGICTELPRLGEPCSLACAEGACGVDEVCVAHSLEGAPCIRDAECEFGLACEGESFEGGVPTPGTCAPVTLCVGT